MSIFGRVRNAAFIVFAIHIATFACGAVNENPLSIKATVAQPDVHPGQSVSVRIQLELDPRYHAYQKQFDLKILQPEGFRASPFKLKPLVTFFDKVSKTSLQGIHEHGDMEFALNVPKELKPATYDVQFEVRYQACADDHCLFPKKLRTQSKINVVALGSIRTSESALAIPGTSSSSSWDLESLLAERSWKAFLAVFFFGILTSFTPCIFPMIPITLSVIGARAIKHDIRAADSSRIFSLNGFILSCIYVLGIALTYALLGIFAAQTGALFGSLLGNPIVVITIALVFVLMGLSMYGLFEIQAPAWIRDSIGAKHTKAGYIGAFVSGLIAGVVAGPCIGPILVSVLTFVARTQDLAFGFFLLFTYALGLGMIFIVLGSFSGLLRALPRSGSWMRVTNVVFGTIMMALAIYYVQPLFSGNHESANQVSVDRGLVEQGSANQSVTGQESAHSLPWKHYSAAEFDHARSLKKPIILDFWAEWCQACKELDRYTYTDRRIQNESQKFELYSFDATSESEQLTDLRKQYGILGLPTLLFFDAQGQLHPELTLTGFESAEQFLDRMKKAEL